MLNNTNAAHLINIIREAVRARCCLIEPTSAMKLLTGILNTKKYLLHDSQEWIKEYTANLMSPSTVKIPKDCRWQANIRVLRQKTVYIQMQFTMKPTCLRPNYAQLLSKNEVQNISSARTTAIYTHC